MLIDFWQYHELIESSLEFNCYLTSKKMIHHATTPTPHAQFSYLAVNYGLQMDVLTHIWLFLISHLKDQVMLKSVQDGMLT